MNPLKSNLMYESRAIVDLFAKDDSLYTIEDWKLLACFYQQQSGEFKDIALALLRDASVHQLAYKKLENLVKKKYGELPRRIKHKGILNATRGRPRKTKDHEIKRSMILEFLSENMTKEQILQKFTNIGKPMSERTYTRILYGK